MQYILSLLFVLLPLLSLSAQNLTRAQAEQEAQAITTQWIADTKSKYQQAWENKHLILNGKIMPFWYTTYGTKPADGYSLFISLHGGHGGGNAPAQINDSQWENQKRLYQPQNSVYLAPRAPYDDWDMWFKPTLDSFYATLIQMCVAYLDVNPDKVYLIGYSAGGDGVWRIAPRMADTWAGASMMAGHPGDVSLLNLRNTPFMVWCGALDAAYNRNRECTQRGVELDSLHTADPNGSPFLGYNNINAPPTPPISSGNRQKSPIPISIGLLPQTTNSNVARPYASPSKATPSTSPNVTIPNSPSTSTTKWLTSTNPSPSA